MSSSVDPKQFWEDKVLTWERSRYGQGATDGSLLEAVAGRASNSLRYRLAITGKLLEPHVRGKRIVELGCGSGLLAAKLMAMGAASYRGFDISENAVAHARELAAGSGLGDTVTFTVRAVQDLPALEADIVFSLGLLDWLDGAALARVFAAAAGADFLHAISERRASVAQLLHRAYVFAAYGWRTGGYIPRYHAVADIAAMAGPLAPKRLHVYRRPELKFSTLVSTLPIDG